MRASSTDRILLTTLVVLFAGFLYTIRNSFEQRIVQKGDSAPSFTVTTDSGKQITRSNFGGKLLVLNFWATWCPPCLEEMPAMERLWRKHKDAGFVLVAVSVDTDPQKVVPFVTEHKLTFPIAFDTKMAIADKYGVRALPSSFILGREGDLAALALGPRHWDNKASHRLIEAMVR